MNRTVISVLIVGVLVLGGAYWYVTKSSSDSSATMEQGSASSGTSDASLDKDTADVDAEMNGLSSDSAAADASLNDSQVEQSSL